MTTDTKHSFKICIKNVYKAKNLTKLMRLISSHILYILLKHFSKIGDILD